MQGNIDHFYMETEISDDDRQFIRDLEEDEKYIHNLPHKKGKDAAHVAELLAIGLRHPKIADILGKERESIEDKKILEFLFPNLSEEERVQKAIRFNTLYGIYLDSDDENWIYSEDGKEFEEYLLRFKHFIESGEIENRA